METKFELLTSSAAEKDFADIFEEQTKRAPVYSSLIFSGLVSTLPYELKNVVSSKQLDFDCFVIERESTDGLRDQHLFIMEDNEQTIRWYYWDLVNKPQPMFLLADEKRSNELTRILSKYWDFKHWL